MYKTVLLLSVLVAAVCLAAPQQDEHFELSEVSGHDQQIPNQYEPSYSASRMNRFLSVVLTCFQLVFTGALGMTCTAITPATFVSNLVQTLLGITISILGWAMTYTTFLPLSGTQVGLDIGRSVLSFVTHLANNYGCTVTNGLSEAINYTVDTVNNRLNA